MSKDHKIGSYICHKRKFVFDREEKLKKHMQEGASNWDRQSNRQGRLWRRSW